MSNRLDPQESRLLHILYLYIQALDAGNLETVARIMSEAEYDDTLGHMLLEINEVYQEADASSISSSEIEYIQDFLLPLMEQEARTRLNGIHSLNIHKPEGMYEHPHELEEEQHRMKDTRETTGTAPTTEQYPLADEGNPPSHRPVRKRRLAHFVQMLAAILMTGLLLSGFLLLLSSRHPISGKPATGGTSNEASIVSVNSADGTVYGLRAQDGAILWHYATGIVDPTVATDSSLAVLNNVVYFAARGRIFALQASSGTLLWHQDVLPASTHIFGSNTYNFSLDSNVLLVRLANNGGETSVLFALNAGNGRILWHYEMNWQYLLAASHGIVYIGSSDVNGDTETLRALRSSDGKELWSYNTGQRYITAPRTILVAGDVLYLQGDVYDEPVTNNTQIFQSLTALDATTGKVIWSKPLHTNPISESSSGQGLLLLANNEVILYNGYHFCAYSSSNGSPVWCSHDFAKPPTHVSSNTIINANIPDFYALAGQALATIKDQIGNTLQVQVEALSLKTGKTAWIKDLKFTSASGIGVGTIGLLIRGDAHAAYAVAGSDIYALNSDNGQELWHITTSIKGITGLAVG
ncbi:MAG TPA: PQQ-binding-like beta-propeller repeat protein [Ktedonobacteraceae bacterium]